MLESKIPWDLDKPTLPNGQPNPSFEAFSAAKKKMYDAHRKEYEAVFHDVQPLAENDIAAWCEELKGSRNVSAPLLRTLLTSGKNGGVESLDLQQFARNVALQNREVAELQLPPTVSLKGIALALARRGFSEFGKSKGLEPEELEARLATPEGQKLLAQSASEIESELKRTARDAASSYIQSIKSTSDAILGLSQDMAIDSCRAGKCDESLLRRWAAVWLKEKGGAARDGLADLAGALVNPITLAVLLDDETKVVLEERAIKLDGSMRYRYATSFVQSSGGAIGIGADPNDPGNQVRTLDDLTAIANRNLSVIAQRYRPVASVERYARIAAFLRWALLAEKAGTLGAINLSALGTIRPNDAGRAPTPDAIAEK